MTKKNALREWALEYMKAMEEMVQRHKLELDRLQVQWHLQKPGEE